MKTNVRVKSDAPKNIRPALLVKEGPEKELHRTISCLMLFEDTFYESGDSITQRIKELVKKVSIPFLCGLAVKARNDWKLRHAPLYLMTLALEKTGSVEDRRLIGTTISEVVQRADELAEILAIYWKSGKKPLPRQLKTGLALAFRKFDEYQLAKYDRANAIRLRDALFLSHPKPKDREQERLWKRLVDNKLESPDTWEVELSSGKEKKEVFTRLLKEGKLGYMALLRNLRNMEESGVDKLLVKRALLEGADGSRALPFRFIAAATHAPGYKDTLSDAMLLSVDREEKLEGKTAILVDVSGSMHSALSGKSSMNAIDAAAGLAVLLKAITPECRVYAFADGGSIRVSDKANGIGLADAIRSTTSGGTDIGRAVRTAIKDFPACERIIVITDEQNNGSDVNSIGNRKGYYVNVAPYEKGMPKREQWVKINGFSERIVDWVREEEKN